MNLKYILTLVTIFAYYLPASANDPLDLKRLSPYAEVAIGTSESGDSVFKIVLMITPESKLQKNVSIQLLGNSEVVLFEKDCFQAFPQDEDLTHARSCDFEYTLQDRLNLNQLNNYKVRVIDKSKSVHESFDSPLLFHSHLNFEVKK
ncbi:MAG: hypothetical protein HOO06_09110 [Bdellovibrionaceae bacterium]|nr:hypothetical protein [Pseudobdellovibrionaceae bacterium]